MDKQNRINLLLGIAFVLALIAVIVQYSNRPGVKPAPNAPGYYTGPMKSKGSDPGVYGDDDGKKVAPPPDANKTTEKPKVSGPGEV